MEALQQIEHYRKMWRSPTILIAFTGPMLFTYMSVWITVGLTVRETRVTTMSEGQSQLQKSQNDEKIALIPLLYSYGCLTLKYADRINIILQQCLQLKISWTIQLIV